jgi:hypothetical protein
MSTSLKNLKNKFNTWRLTNTPNTQIPIALKQKSIDLLSKHSISEISKAAKVTSKTIYNWQKKIAKTIIQPAIEKPQNFVSLPVVSKKNNLSTISLTLELPHNIKLQLINQPHEQSITFVQSLVQEIVV